MFEILDSNTAIIYSNEPNEIIKAASTLIGDDILSCSVTSVNIFDEKLPVLSFRRKNSSRDTEIILMRTAERDAEEEMAQEPVEEPEPAIEPEKTEEPKPEEPQEVQEETSDISDLIQQRKIIKENIDNIRSSIADLQVSYIDVYTGRDVGLGEEDVKDWLPNIPPGKRHPSKGYIGIDYMPGRSNAEGESMPWVVIDRSPGKGKPNILKSFSTEEEAKEYYNNVLTPGTGESKRIRDLRQRNYYLKRLNEQAKKIEDPVKAKKVFDANMRKLNRFDRLMARIRETVNRRDLLDIAKRDPEFKKSVEELYNFASTLGVKLEDLMGRHVPTLSQLEAIMTGIAADAENIELLDVSDLPFETTVEEDETKPLRGKIIAPQSREEMMEYVKKITPKQKLKTV